MVEWNAIHQRAADTIRILSAEAVQQAKSGHPGLPMGCADIMHVLWYRYLHHNPANPKWFGRDRFILSAGHGSMLLYSMLYLYNYGLTEEDLRNFRQWGSRTPGHPEFGETVGVEVSTGPLGAGFATGTGMAIAAKHLRYTSGLSESDIRKPKIFILCGDGCMMEGITAESAALAGHLKLDNLVVIYDSNRITIEGSTDLAWSSDVRAQFQAHNWRIVEIENGNDMAQCDKGLHDAIFNCDARPTLVISHTRIGYGSPGKEGKASSHGEPLGEAELIETRKALGFPPERSFTVEPEVRKLYTEHAKALALGAEKWDAHLNGWRAAHPDGAKVMDDFLNPVIPADLYEQMVSAVKDYAGKSVATRQAGGDVLQVIAQAVPSLMGGAADLAPSTKTFIKNSAYFEPGSYTGRNIHFGVREFAMGLAGNGMALWGAAIPFTSTFFVFSDYMKPALRLAAMQKVRHLFIFTHDSFHVGEDGPTHQPIEHLTMVRTIPDMTLFRPADAFETAAAYDCAMRLNGPSAIILTRQNVPTVTVPEGLLEKVARGAYVLSDEADFDVVLIATGSEVSLALESAVQLRAAGKKVRVVSMPSMERFMRQDKAYRDAVLPQTDALRVSIEAGSTCCWYRFVGLDGLAIGIDHFGASAPSGVLSEKFGFTAAAVTEKVLAKFAARGEA